MPVGKKYACLELYCDIFLLGCHEIEASTYTDGEEYTKSEAGSHDECQSKKETRH